MFDTDVVEEIVSVAKTLGVDQAALLAVAEVESGGKVFAVVEGRREPLIRFEGHYFDRRLSGAKRDTARKAGLASPTAGAIANPSRQADRWKLLARAAAIDRKAAHESVSWGLGQVMGAHWAWLGYADIEALVAEARSGAAGQMRLMCHFIAKSGLDAALRNRDWEAFARGYNGPAFRRNAYHTKLAAAFGRYSSSRGSVPSPAAIAIGDSGERVSLLQAGLARLGYAVAVDGRFGPATRAALVAFQKAEGLVADGIFGPQTAARLEHPARASIRDAAGPVDMKSSGVIQILRAMLDRVASWWSAG